MLAGATKTVTLKDKYDGTTQSSEQTGTVTLTFNFTRLKGGTGEVVVDNSYIIGEKVRFAGSDWYVIEDSDASQDYVVALKENVLTNAELGEYAIGSTNKMSYYWSSTCHSANIYGYTEEDTSGCAGHNSYAESKVKEYLEGVYLPLIDSNNTKLKEVNSYKIRLITKDEMIDHLGCTSSDCTSSEYQAWLRFSGTGINYWTMTPYRTEYVWLLMSNGLFGWFYYISNSENSIRPVINLYKNAID